MNCNKDIIMTDSRAVEFIKQQPDGTDIVVLPPGDCDIQALHLINEAMRRSTPEMRKANLDFIYAKWQL